MSICHLIQDVECRSSLVQNHHSTVCLRTMGRRYKKHLGMPVRQNYQAQNLCRAVQEVKAGCLSYRRAAEKFGIPKSNQLDVSFFKPFKNAWCDILNNCKKFTIGSIPKDVFPSLLKEPLKKIEANKSRSIISCFWGTGLIPFIPNHVLSKLPDSEETPDTSKEN